MNCASSERNNHLSGCVSVAARTSPRTVGNSARKPAVLRIMRILLRTTRKTASCAHSIGVHEHGPHSRFVLIQLHEDELGRVGGWQNSPSHCSSVRSAESGCGSCLNPAYQHPRNSSEGKWLR